MQEARRNFPFVKVKGFGKRPVAAGGESSLLIVMPHTGWPLGIANIPNILILCVHFSSIPRKTQTRSFPEDFLEIKSQNKKACILISQDVLSQNSNEEMVLRRPFEACRPGGCLLFLRQGDCAWGGGALKLSAVLPHLLVKSGCWQNQRTLVARGPVGVFRRDGWLRGREGEVHPHSLRI